MHKQSHANSPKPRAVPRDNQNGSEADNLGIYVASHWKVIKPGSEVAEATDSFKKLPTVQEHSRKRSPAHAARERSTDHEPTLEQSHEVAARVTMERPSAPERPAVFDLGLGMPEDDALVSSILASENPASQIRSASLETYRDSQQHSWISEQMTNANRGRSESPQRGATGLENSANFNQIKLPKQTEYEGYNPRSSGPRKLPPGPPAELMTSPAKISIAQSPTRKRQPTDVMYVNKPEEAQQ